ncbi:MAG: hypothetical protein U9N83_05245 [Thermodesulfobacteriota bacterium]|nr:hypothetical protein [Thermodesulfobacteriota bacterium]
MSSFIETFFFFVFGAGFLARVAALGAALAFVAALGLAVALAFGAALVFTAALAFGVAFALAAAFGFVFFFVLAVDLSKLSFPIKNLFEMVYDFIYIN